jgi:hypothetical protein|tara:strand:- start:2448 stop:2765 length:318 start_codon:yes stop_codon:yes gene_type:complete
MVASLGNPILRVATLNTTKGEIIMSRYKCNCCGVEVSMSGERDRGSWCLNCFPPTKMFGGCGKNLCDDGNKYGEYVAPLIIGVKKVNGDDFTDDEIDGLIGIKEE